MPPGFKARNLRSTPVFGNRETLVNHTEKHALHVAIIC
jgi:hypothetical protein